MPDREKVMNGLKCCSEIKEKCDDCPYSGVLRCMMVLKRDALELLKAQEPRAVSPTEAYTADFVYVEFGGVITPALRTSNERGGHRESYFATQQLGGEWMRWDDYGITWRCWTSRPTEEQRKATQWEPPKEG